MFLSQFKIVKRHNKTITKTIALNLARYHLSKCRLSLLKQMGEKSIHKTMHKN